MMMMMIRLFFLVFPKHRSGRWQWCNIRHCKSGKYWFVCYLGTFALCGWCGRSGWYGWSKLMIQLWFMTNLRVFELLNTLSTVCTSLYHHCDTLCSKTELNSVESTKKPYVWDVWVNLLNKTLESPWITGKNQCGDKFGWFHCINI